MKTMEKKAELIKIPSLVQRYLPTGFTSHPISSYLIALHPNCKSLDKDLQSCKRLMVIISGPSGVGKNSLADGLTLKHFSKIKTATTRSRRLNESKDAYYWLSQKQFADSIKKGAFLEYATYDGNLYGTLRDEIKKVIDIGKIPIFVVDPRVGSKKLLDLKSQGEPLLKNTLLIFIYIVPANLSELKKRLLMRDTMQAKIRFKVAKVDLKFMFYAHYIAINRDGDLKKLTKEIEDLLLKSCPYQGFPP